MIPVVAAVIGVILTALIGITIRNYRNLITYEITSIRHELIIKGDQIAPFDDGDRGPPTRVFSFYVKLVNRGWKNLHDVKVHSDGDFQPFAVEKTATSISPETISLGRRGKSLEIAIDFMPKKEEVTLSFSTLSRWTDLHKLTGAGPSYKVESIHYYYGQQKALAFLKSLLVWSLVGGAVGIIIQSAHNDSSKQKPPPPEVKQSSAKP